MKPLTSPEPAVTTGAVSGGAGYGRYLAIYLAIAIPVHLLFAGWTDVTSMEGIIALCGRNMRLSSDWIIPRLYGEIYAFKPALLYWMAAGTESLFGRQTELSLRLPTALCGIAIGLSLLLVMSALTTPRCGLICALAGITNGIFLEESGIAGFDVPLALGSTLAILAACRNLSAERSDWRWWLLGYAGLWFGFMSKGLPVLAIYAPGLLLAARVAQRFERLFHWTHLLGVALFLGGAAAYLYLAYRAAQLDAFKQHLGEVLLRSSRLGGALLKIPLKPLVVAGVFAPWSVAIIYAAVKQRGAYQSSPAGRTWRMAWAFLITGVAVYVLTTPDETRYYLPLLAPMAMVAGMSVDRLPAPHASRAAIILTGLGLCVWLINGGIVQPERAKKRSLREVAAQFAPHVPPDARVYVDSFDGFSSLFYYLDRDTRHRRSQLDRRDRQAFFVLVSDQDNPWVPPTGLRFESVASVIGPDRRLYTLARLTDDRP